MPRSSSSLTRLARTPAAFQREFLENLHNGRGVDLNSATPNDCYQALGYTVRQYLMQRWLATQRAQRQAQAKTVYYLSAEYLPGRQLDNNLLNADLEDLARQALSGLGLDLDRLRALEVEPGLGNGGLGRLAACFMDSLATLQIPAVGYGLRYEFGIFTQALINGWQVERPDDWLALGSPWEFAHPDQTVTVGFGGLVDTITDDTGQERRLWLPEDTVKGQPYNYMVPGYGTDAVNTLRLWRARSSQEFDLQTFNAGDYIRAVHEKTLSENITKVLYPEDSTPQGRLLRLQQQYFFVACSLWDLLRALPNGFDLRHLPDRAVIQLNDAHPTLAIAELMRLLVDVHSLPWDTAWDVTRRTFAYTNHTLLPEALEKWPVTLLEQLLPRHLQIIYDINQHFLDAVRRQFPGDHARARRLSLIEETPEKQVRMAHLAAVGSFRVNGVAALQSRLLREHVLRDFAELWPEKFTNVTNGVTPRRFMRLANPPLAALITETIGAGWLNDLEQLRRLEPLADDAAFRAQWRTLKHHNKTRLATLTQTRLNLVVDPTAVFDVMVKRLHEYKRQWLKALHIITLYHRWRDTPQGGGLPRVVFFGAKAAPGYRAAKHIIKLINSVAEVVNRDPRVSPSLKVVYWPNYNVTLAENIIPAADISEQISLAGKEASGTGNMKLALNGALTVGTLDGANIEIRDLVGPENFFLFGLTEEQVRHTRAAGYQPYPYYERDPHLRRALDDLAAGAFSPSAPTLFRPLVDDLLHNDPYLVLADYAAYVACQDEAERLYHDPERWTRMSILNCARCGYFSSDRSIRDYATNIWQVEAVPVTAAPLVSVRPRHGKIV
jgi:starch phosphorylase